MPPRIGSRRRARVTAGAPPVRRRAETKRARRGLGSGGLASASPTTVLTVLWIGLGASLIFVSLAVGGSVERSIGRAVEADLGRADLRVSAVEGGTLSEDTLVTIRSVLGVEVAAPAVEQPATLLPEDAAAPSLAPVTIHGIDPLLDARIRDLDLAAGDTITRRDQAAAIITERLAADEGYGLGSDLIVATLGEPERFRVIGIAAGDGPLAEAGGRIVILPIDAVARMFGLEGVARADLLVTEGVPHAGVLAELDEALAGTPYIVTSPADLAETLRLPTSGLAVAGLGTAAAGLLVGAVVVFGAVRLTGRGSAELPRDERLRAPIGAGVGAVLAFVLGLVTGSDVVPAVLGLAGVIGAVVVTGLCAMAAVVLAPRPVGAGPARVLTRVATRLGRFAERTLPGPLRADAAIARTALERDPAGTARMVLLLAIPFGLVVAVAMIGESARHTGVDQSTAPVLERVVAQIEALGWLALVVAGLSTVGSVAMWARSLPEPRRVRVLAAGTLGLTGSAVGSVAGLLLGAAIALLGGGRLDPMAGLPWAALAVSLALGTGLSMVAAWLEAGVNERPPVVRAVRFG